DNIELDVPSSPVVTIFGAFHDAYTGQPLADLVFTVATAKGIIHEGRTDANGHFQMDDIAQGQFVMAATLDGHIPFRAVMLANPNGFGVANTDNVTNHIGTILLLPNDTTWNFSSYTEDGRPVANATLYVESPTAFIDDREN